MRYFIELSYKGTNYHGWQFQPNAITVQEELEKVFSLLLNSNIKITGAGRTDTGVHAINYIAHIDVNEQIPDIPKLLYKANSFLNQDIAIYDIYKVKDDVHSRFSAISRTYEYRIHKTKNPFLKDVSYYINSRLNFEKMNKAAMLLFEYEDFTSFSKLHTDTKTNICKIIKANWKQRGEQMIFTIEADRFLRNMVRAITGTLLEIGKGKINLNDFRKVIESKNRSNAGVSVPAHGLFLTEIRYPDEILSE
ncbi:MAG: tRNA pseudouridine(38-40) synthase TruA [Bacteroidales bacterium]|nr:tRNA pseudouridine(38-40) synthase TruA [Bacteroidales bacterium]